jgi:GGDEF domain-containing protein
MLVGVVAAVQFSVPTSQTYGIATLYLWPIAIVALWFGARIAVGVVGAIMAMQAVWVLTVAPNSATGGLVSVVLRSATYLFIASLVGHFASRLRRVALTDPLTGLPNRRAFFEEVRRRSQTVASIGVVTCDVDGLKRINDRDGHDAGDAAIIRTGQDLLRLLGDGGFVARFGGDVFLGLTTPEMGERIAAALDPVGGARVGVAVHSTTGEGSIDAAIAAADQSLYRAKRRAA